MKQRVITAIVLGLFLITVIFFGDLPFILFVYGISTIGLVELLKMRKIAATSFPGILSIVLVWMYLIPEQSVALFDLFTKSEATLMVVFILLAYTVLVKNKFTFDEVGFLVLSSIYVGMGFYYLILTREAGAHFLFFALFLMWATDTGAFLFGKKMGKRKLWPKISPKKTIEGSIGGIVLSVIVAAIFQMIMPVHSSMLIVLLIAILVSICGQIGDLVESAYKRHYSVKDSGKLLPGHGGVLDRFDSLIFVVPILHFIQFIT